MRFWRVALISTPLVTLAFGFYLWMLYGQLREAFNHRDQFLPTRIYSDVSRLTPPQPRSHVEARLQALGYKTQKDENTLTFTLHPVEYPNYLIPDGHPTVDAAGKPVVLHFDGDDPDSLLQSIESQNKEVPELYLEPELVATLSRGGTAGKKEIRELVKFDDIPAGIWRAIIAIEDQHFMDHKGLDPRGIARAIWVNLKTLSFAQGGSTLTQQLVKNLMARHTKNVFRKINELFLALLLETSYDKETILERYLNEVYLGQVGSIEVHGVAEGAKHFFGKSIHELNLAEMALMAGLIRGPGFYSPYRYLDRAMERQRLVLRKMVETGQIAQPEAEAAMKLTIRLAPPQTSANKAPYFVDFVKAEMIRQLKDKISEQEITEAGFRVYTTLDMSLNVVAQQAVAEGITALEKRMKLEPVDRLEGALATVDQSTGFIRALIGGRSYSQSTFNRILNMKRQVGSTFKPIVYLTALEKGNDPNGVAYGPGHPAEDAPWTLVYDHGRQTWTPKNYEKEFMGWISYRTALAHSVNTVAARVGYEVGIDNIIKTARALGVESELPRVPSLALGVAELSPIELLRVYSTFGNHGTQEEMTVIRVITQNDGAGFRWFTRQRQQILDPGAVDVLTDMLQSVFTDGTARAATELGFDRPAAGKTGTTSHHRDAWFAGYTPQLTTVVWVGMDTPPAPDQPTKVTLTGAGAALPIWVRFMTEGLAVEPPVPFPLSSGVANVTIDRHSGKQATSNCPSAQIQVEKYVKGHEPGAEACEPLWPDSVPKTAEQ